MTDMPGQIIHLHSDFNSPEQVKLFRIQVENYKFIQNLVSEISDTWCHYIRIINMNEKYRFQVIK